MASDSTRFMHAVFKNCRTGRINVLLADLGTLGGVGGDDGLGVLVEGVEPLLDGLHVVVHPAGGLAPLECARRGRSPFQIPRPAQLP